jgi:hypothetical protein
MQKSITKAVIDTSFSGEGSEKLELWFEFELLSVIISNYS